MTQLRRYRVALGISIVLNVLLATVIRFYSSVESLLSIVEAAVGFVD